MQATPTYQLVELKLGENLADYVRDGRTQGLSWRQISLAIRDRASIDVSFETLRNWFPETKAPTA